VSTCKALAKDCQSTLTVWIEIRQATQLDNSFPTWHWNQVAYL